MRGGGRPERPVIVVLADGAESTVREVLAGIEEEGVPCTVQGGALIEPGMTAADLAIRAAQRSPLQVGVGVGTDGAVSLCHARVEQPVLDIAAGATSSAAARTMGHNAARIVTALPLRTLTAPDDG